MDILDCVFGSVAYVLLCKEIFVLLHILELIPPDRDNMHLYEASELTYFFSFHIVRMLLRGFSQ